MDGDIRFGVKYFIYFGDRSSTASNAIPKTTPIITIIQRASMINYYKILQIDPSAEQEVIDAAYRRLMFKYHPDVLPEELRYSKDILDKVQELNEAYEVLGNPERRTEYDIRMHPPQKVRTGPKIPIEKRMCQIKCSKTKRTFNMLLGRRQGTTGRYRVMGFEPVEEIPAQGSGLVGKIKGLIVRPAQISTQESQRYKTKTGFLCEDDIQALFDETETLQFGNIDWAGYTCPDCSGAIEHENGNKSNWAICGHCSRLKCVGGSVKLLDGFYYSTCPWCGTKNKVSRIISPGDKSHLPISGEKQFIEKEDTTPLLKGDTPKQLKR
jgi:curved DNA-binding protein CbpA